MFIPADFFSPPRYTDLTTQMHIDFWGHWFWNHNAFSDSDVVADLDDSEVMYYMGGEL